MPKRDQQAKRRSDTAGVDDVRVECFLLCDYLRFENGKLDIIGGGWDEIRPPVLPGPYQFSIAVKLALPPRLVAQRLDLRFELADEAGRVVEPEGSRVGTDIEANPHPERGPAVVGETPFVLPLQMSLTLIKPGTYTLRLILNGEPVARTAFRVVAPLDQSSPMAGSSIGPTEELDRR